MACEYGYEDCRFEGKKCDYCFTPGQFYKPKKMKKHYGLNRVQQKADHRMGSQFEYANHKRNNKELKDISSSMTLNSGATVYQKGDEHIGGYVKVAEELKTQMPDRARGCKSFTIQRKWLDKLNVESKREGQEFWYLKFAFSEAEGINPAGSVFVVTEQDMIMRMIATMQEDRAKADLCDKKIDVAIRQRDLMEAKLKEAEAKIALYEADKALMQAIEAQKEEVSTKDGENRG